MAVYAAFLSGGSQIGPVIAGYLIEARCWRWFFYLCAIITAANLVSTILLLPETIHEPEDDPQQIDDNEKDTHSHIEAMPSRPEVGDRAKMDYGEYWRGLYTFQLTKEAKEKGVLKYFAYLFVLPFPLLLVPGILIASIMYGVMLGG